jgi:hypothetical protein
MPADVEAGMRLQGLLRADGPHAPDTVRRRLTSWSILTRWRGLTGSFSAPSLKSASGSPFAQVNGQGSGKAREPLPAIF